VEALRSKLFPVEPGQYVPEESDDWARARLGRITASDRAGRVLLGDKQANQVLDELEFELREGRPFSEFKGNWATRHGNKFEDQALAEYNMARLSGEEMVCKPGFTVSRGCQILGASPDFLIGEDTVGQVKCPAITGNHVSLLYGGPGKYKNQIQCESLVTGRPNIIFITYDPRMPSVQQLGSHELLRDEKLQTRLMMRALQMEEMLFSGRRYTIGRARVEAGIPALF
jgi:hypothetical protein